MAATYEPIQTYTFTTSGTSINFTSIPSTYTDLRIVVVATKAASAGTAMRLNADTSSSYSQINIEADGATATSNYQSANTISLNWSNAVSTAYPFLSEIDIFSYNNSLYKSVLVKYSHDANGSGYIVNNVAVYRTSSAINQVSIYGATNHFAAGSMATIYGIKAA
jgi:hypothetical protein